MNSRRSRVIDFKAINIARSSTLYIRPKWRSAHMNRVNGWVAMVIRVGGRADDYNERNLRHVADMQAPAYGIFCHPIRAGLITHCAQ